MPLRRIEAVIVWVRFLDTRRNEVYERFAEDPARPTAEKRCCGSNENQLDQTVLDVFRRALYRIRLELLVLVEEQGPGNRCAPMR